MRQKKDGIYLNVKIDSALYRKLESVSDEAGQTKTLITERALSEYFDRHDRKMKVLDEHMDEVEL